MIPRRIDPNPFQHGVGIEQGRGKFPLGGQTVVEIHKGEAPTGHIHAVAAVDLFAAVDIAAAVDADDGGQGRIRSVGIVDVQQIPFSFGSVGDVSAFGDALGQRDRCIPFPVRFARLQMKKKALQ